MSTLDADRTMAVFLDLENVALGAHDAHLPRFDIQKILERLLLKGHIVVKKAYCDFDRYKEFKRDLHEAAFELIEIPHLRQSGKNSADIRMVVDALDLCYTKGHVDTFAIISGDSDFSPLVSKLRENAKKVIGAGVKNSSSDLFIRNCDEFLYYDDLVRPTPPAKPKARAKSVSSGSASGSSGAHSHAPASPTASAASHASGPHAASGSKSKDSLSPEKAVTLLAQTFEAITAERDTNEPIWGSMVKQAMRRRDPGFNERAFGFRTFKALLIEAENRGLMKLEAEAKSGDYLVRPVD